MFARNSRCEPPDVVNIAAFMLLKLNHLGDMRDTGLSRMSSPRDETLQEQSQSQLSCRLLDY
jgi:hypothetical protein